MARKKEFRDIAITVRIDAATAKFLDYKVSQMKEKVGNTANRNSLIEALIHKWKDEDDKYRERTLRAARNSISREGGDQSKS